MSKNAPLRISCSRVEEGVHVVWESEKHPGWCNECGVTHSPVILGCIAKVLFERWNIVWKSIRGSYFWTFTVWKAVSCEQEEINIVSIKGAIHAGVFLMFVLKNPFTRVFVCWVRICFSKWSLWNNWLFGGGVVEVVVIGTVGWAGRSGYGHPFENRN